MEYQRVVLYRFKKILTLESVVRFSLI